MTVAASHLKKFSSFGINIRVAIKNKILWQTETQRQFSNVQAMFLVNHRNTALNTIKLLCLFIFYFFQIWLYSQFSR